MNDDTVPCPRCARPVALHAPRIGKLWFGLHAPTVAHLPCFFTMGCWRGKDRAELVIEVETNSPLEANHHRRQWVLHSVAVKRDRLADVRDIRKEATRLQRQLAKLMGEA